MCAERAHRLSGTCEACGEQRWWTVLSAVEEEDSLLSWYPVTLSAAIAVAMGLGMSAL